VTKPSFAESSVDNLNEAAPKILFSLWLTFAGFVSMV
jgi:hypothetical protein